jgi:hypothetical protein
LAKISDEVDAEKTAAACNENFHDVDYNIFDGSDGVARWNRKRLQQRT